MTHISEVIDDEQRNYLIKYYGHLMKEAEHYAYKTTILRLKFPNVIDQEFRRLSFGLANGSDPEVQALLAKGDHAFFVKICKRLLREHKDAIFLNYCPRCSGLVRTPTAKQCRHCFFSWHHTAA